MADTLDGYTIGETLGKGEFVIVKEAVDLATGEKVAIKILDKAVLKQTRKIDQIRREIKVLKKLDHSNIAKLHKMVETDSHYYYYFHPLEQISQMRLK